MMGEKPGVRGSPSDYWQRNMEEQKGEKKHWLRVGKVNLRKDPVRRLKGTPGLVLNMCCS